MVNQLWPLSRFTWHYIWDDFKMCVRSYKIVIVIVSVKSISNYQLWVYPIQKQSSKLLHMQVQWCEKTCFCLKTSIEYTEYTLWSSRLCRATFSIIWRMVFCRTSHHCGGIGTLFFKALFQFIEVRRFAFMHSSLHTITTPDSTVPDSCWEVFLLINAKPLHFGLISHFFQKSLICSDASMQNKAMQSCSF